MLKRYVFPVIAAGAAVAIWMGALLLGRVDRREGPPTITAAETAGQATHTRQALDAPARAPVARAEPLPPVVQPTEPAEESSQPSTAPDPATRPVTDRLEWPAEYADKAVEDLVADEARLRTEFKAEIAAERERRFKSGEYVVYLHSEWAQRRNEPTYGITETRMDENTVLVVSLDPRIEPALFSKQRKADWLLEQIRVRRGR